MLPYLQQPNRQIETQCECTASWPLSTNPSFPPCFRLKTERRSVVSTRQEKEELLQKEARLSSELEGARRREEAHRSQIASLQREVTELRQAFSSSRQQAQQQQTQAHFAWETQQDMVQRVAQERDLALQEVGALAEELESLQVVLSSPGGQTTGNSRSKNMAVSLGPNQR